MGIGQTGDHGTTDCRNQGWLHGYMVRWIVRFKVRPQKILLGVVGFMKRAEWNLKGQTRHRIPLNPWDKNSKVAGLPTEVVSEEFVEQGPTE